MARESVLAALCDAIVRIDAPHAIRVSVDGIDGSGKTQLADDLAPIIEAAGRACYRASIDDFRWPGHRDRSLRREFTPESYYETSYDYDALRDSLLSPLVSPGTHRVLLSKWGNIDDQPAERWADIKDDAVVIVDGIFLQRPGLAALWDYRVWIDVERELALARARRRDLAWVGSDEEIVDRYCNRNFPAHEIYLARTNARELADAIIDNNDPPHATAAFPRDEVP